MRTTRDYIVPGAYFSYSSVAKDFKLMISFQAGKRNGGVRYIYIHIYICSMSNDAILVQ